ncbi:LGFP repeat-containing protein [Rhodococcus qingshengii]|uniref:LGFP repeat-containing protein n=1 Tax=Rhodococcus qingshengii TaxID=334542 RepID=UPI00294395CB|nr:hypothetical protein [Rhodococcus qingshengii]WOI90341.1 hypothetical protein R0122_29775 [Rhodococcus qingshengii]
MRSDREEIPGGFTKEEADEAEVKEARLQMARVAEGCQIYWPSPNEVCGLIRDKYNLLGGPGSFLSFPRTNELTNPDGFGRRSEFLGGSIYWSPASGANSVAHHFLLKWADHGYEAGWMGYPLTEELINADGIGRRQQFQGGYIYWSPLPGAHSIGGTIFQKWGELGYETGSMGYPTSDEINTIPEFASVSQRMNWFVGGALLWDGGTNTVQVANRSSWASLTPN